MRSGSQYATEALLRLSRERATVDAVQRPLQSLFPISFGTRCPVVVADFTHFGIGNGLRVWLARFKRKKNPRVTTDGLRGISGYVDQYVQQNLGDD